MSNEAIALAQKFAPEKLHYPAYISEKLDGVPVRVMILSTDYGSTVRVYTRQWEIAVSCFEHATKLMDMNNWTPGWTYNFVFEVTHDTLKGFKDVSGVVRRQSPQDGLVFNLFDFDAGKNAEGISGKGFETRIMVVQHFKYPPNFRMIMQMPLHDQATIEDMLNHTVMEKDQEGWCVRSGDAPFKPGTRHWDYQKIVKEPTIDLWIVGMEEGVGKFAGGVGRLIAEYKGEQIGIGPGKQTTAERNALWMAYCENVPNHGKMRRMACIKYKPDDGYEALRQPTFQCWRDDKTVPDA